MSATPEERLAAAQLETLIGLALQAPEAALGVLTQQGLAHAETLTLIAEAALARADDDPDAARALLATAGVLNAALGSAPDATALIEYARARVLVRQGELAQAERELRQAQQRWATSGATAWLTRSYLGMTQILAMQGRYAEAEGAARAAIASMTPADAGNPATLFRLATAHRNLATLLLYQERHREALDEYASAERYLDQVEDGGDDAATRAERGHIALNRASALTYLDRPDEAETALQRAVDLFEASEDTINRGRALTNLGRLYLRTGQYADALAAFDRATRDLIGDVPAEGEPDVERLRQADELLLEHAIAYLALNLLPEAARALEQCEALFRRAEQPYELGQTLYSKGLARLLAGDAAGSRRALGDALAQFNALENRFWMNRTEVALATLEFRQADAAGAEARLDRLLGVGFTRADAEALAWDVGGEVEARLLRLAVRLAQGEVAPARAEAGAIGNLIGDDGQGRGDSIPLPHMLLRLEHARGQIEQAAGRQDLAQWHLRRGIDLLEAQRATLPIEEIRTAFLENKAGLYSDLVVSLLATGDVAGAFEMVERARSRALLERLAMSMNSQPEPVDAELAARRETVRRRVHWLYNQLLGEVRSVLPDAAARQRLEQEEANLRALEWQSASMMGQAEPAQLAAFQAALDDEQQAVVYFFAGAEVLAFVVTRDEITVARGLARVDEVEAALAEMRFQLGRVELGPDYVARHAARLTQRLHEVLHTLYTRLLAPLRLHLTRPRLLVVPYGALHLLPFHALWDGSQFMVERYGVSYAPSASMAIHCMQQARRQIGYRTFAGLAIEDEAIPAARQEVTLAAQRFAMAHVYLDSRATRVGLEEAARLADVLHMATHGLFRPDNSFFSALKLADGWVDVREVYRLPLRAQLVVLSACESGAGTIRGGDEVIGLARGFMGAGAANLVVSLWNVHDASAAQLMDSFYRHLTHAPDGARPAAALAAAQREAVMAGRHPYYWAPFAAIG